MCSFVIQRQMVPGEELLNKYFTNQWLAFEAHKVGGLSKIGLDYPHPSPN